MYVVKFTKTSTSSLVAHVDTLRAVTYVLRRANVDVQYSQGYNPHVELGFSAPIALGVQSNCEYVSFVAPSQSHLLAKLNAVCPQGLCFTKVWQLQTNVATAFNRAKYLVTAKGIGNVIAEITQQGYEITYLDRGESVTKDVSMRIFDAQAVDADNAYVTLATGNDNLRPDRVVCHLMSKHQLVGDYAITKVQAFHDQTDSDCYLDDLQAKQQNAN